MLLRSDLNFSSEHRAQEIALSLGISLRKFLGTGNTGLTFPNEASVYPGVLEHA